MLREVLLLVLQRLDCSDLNTSYTDLSGVIGNGTLENFSSCDSGNHAWQGTGVNTDPYRLELIDGSSSRVALLKSLLISVVDLVSMVGSGPLQGG